MESHLKVLLIDAGSGFYRIERFMMRDFFGPVDLGLHLAAKHNSLNIGIGLLAGSIIPGSNRLIFSGFSPCWHGFYVSSMGGAGLVFDNLGVNMVSLMGKAPVPSVLALNRFHGEDVQVQITPIDLSRIWREGRGGTYSLMDHVHAHFAGPYKSPPRILAVGPAAKSTDFGAIGSVPITDNGLTHVDTWAGRGGFGTKMLRDHGIAAVIYGGTAIDEDFLDRKVADGWFQERYNKKLAAKDLEATTKYRYDPAFNTGGTFGVNFATLRGRILAFNYNSIYMDEAERLELHAKFIVNHYLKQFNEETIATKQQRNCGEPCAAVCKKMHNEFKKDYEPYQTMGPLTGIFDQRAAEKLNRAADSNGFDAISVGGILAWLFECLSKDLLSPQELGVSTRPVFSQKGFSIEADSMHNADLGVEMIDAILEKRGLLDLQAGARKMARRLARDKGKAVLDAFLYCAFARGGWVVPNQYWSPGVLAPMPIMGKYYMHYGAEFLPPRELGRKSAQRMRQELILDNLGTCRFHRIWAEEMLPEILGTLWGAKDAFLANIRLTASRINSRNSSLFWESERCSDFVYTFMKRRQTVDGDASAELRRWIEEFEKDKHDASLNYWYEVHKGIQETLREF